jgi:hypothetical protein
VPAVVRKVSANKTAIRTISSRSSINSSQSASSSRNALRNSWTSRAVVPVGKRGFSATKAVKHEHVKPPAPGKEYVCKQMDLDSAD